MKLILSVCALLAVLGSCSRSKFGIIAEGDNTKPEGKLVSYQYSYSGTMAYPIDYFRIDRNKDGVLRLGWSKDDTDIHLVRIPEESLQIIDSIAKQHKLWNLKNSYRPKMQVYDGYGWSFCLEYEKGSIYSGGTNAYAGGELSQGMAAIESYVRTLAEASTPADSMGIMHHHSYNGEEDIEL